MLIQIIHLIELRRVFLKVYTFLFSCIHTRMAMVSNAELLPVHPSLNHNYDGASVGFQPQKRQDV